MKKALSGLLVVALIGALFITFFANVPAKAATKTKFSVETLKEKTSTGTKKQSKYEYSNGNGITTEYIYKIEIKKPGYIILTNKENNSVDVYKDDLDALKSHIEKYNSDTRNKILLFTTSTKKEKNYIPLDKGTYYLYPSYGDFNIEYKFSEADIDYKNYTAKTAKKLKSGKDEIVCMPYGTDACLWYQFDLTKKKSVTVTVDRMYNDYTRIIVFDEFGTSYDLLEDDNAYITKSLEKGTYYIKFYNASPYDFSQPALCKFRWK